MLTEYLAYGENSGVSNSERMLFRLVRAQSIRAWYITEESLDFYLLCDGERAFKEFWGKGRHTQICMLESSS